MSRGSKAMERESNKVRDAVFVKSWGMWRRTPYSIQIEKKEKIYLGLLISSVLVILWLMLLQVSVVSDFLSEKIDVIPSGVVEGQAGISSSRGADNLQAGATDIRSPKTSLQIAILLIMLVIPPLIYSLLPESVFYKTKIAEVLFYSRLRGGMMVVDVLLFAIIIIGGVLLAMRPVFNNHIPYLSVSFESAIALGFLMLIGCIGCLLIIFFKKMEFIPSGRNYEPPFWLKRVLEGGDEEFEGDGVSMPEDNASFEYQFPADARFQSSPDAVEMLGIRVNDEILNKLREINIKYDGRLYSMQDYKNIAAVVLLKDDPVNGTGTEELTKLIKQICLVAGKNNWTGYELASAVLNLVQKSIAYEHDDISTKRILGKMISEYGRMPLETLVDGVGDCECTAILAVSLLSYLGFNCALLQVEVPPTQISPGGGHLAVGLELDQDLIYGGNMRVISDDSIKHGGRSYLYGETATDEERPDGFGVIPLCWKHGMVIEKVIPIHPVQNA